MADKFWLFQNSKRSKLLAEYNTPEELWAACVEYFDFCADCPIQHNVHSFSQGALVTGEVEKPRAFSLRALLRFIGVTMKEWEIMKNSDTEFARPCHLAEDIIFQQLYELGAADVLNANFVARSLGMGDKQTLQGPGPNGEHTMINTLDVSGLSLDQLDALQDALLASLPSKSK